MQLEVKIHKVVNDYVWTMYVSGRKQNCFINSTYLYSRECNYFKCPNAQSSQQNIYFYGDVNGKSVETVVIKSYFNLIYDIRPWSNKEMTLIVTVLGTPSSCAAGWHG